MNYVEREGEFFSFSIRKKIDFGSTKKEEALKELENMAEHALDGLGVSACVIITEPAHEN